MTEAGIVDTYFVEVAELIQSGRAHPRSPSLSYRNIRQRHKRGSLPDVGLYCLNTTRFLLGEEPTEVSALIHSPPNDPRFREVEDAVLWQMVFPSGALASCASSYASHESRRYRVHGETGWIGMDPAFSYDNLRTEPSSAQGEIENRSQLKLSPKNQFALEMDHFGECVRANKTPYTPGEEGLQDQRLMEAIYQSANTGKPVRLVAATPGELDQFRGSLPQS